MSIIWLMIVLLIAAFAASIIISGIMFSRATRENREKGGVVIRATAEITDGNETLYAAITGDQVAITNIRLSKPTA